MEVRSYKLPPLPNRKNAPVQIQMHSQKMMMPAPRVTSYSREKDRKSNLFERPSSEEKSIRRPVSVRQKSIESVRSRQSVNSRESRGSRNSNAQSTEIKRHSVQYNVKMRISMPTVSAKSWAIFEMNQEKFIYGKRIFKKRQIASLTKMMNFITILELIDNYGLEASKIRFKVSRQASFMIGTTAQLKMGSEFCLEELFYGMMLPSGNDAAYQIAQIGGSLIQMQKNLGYIDKKIVYNVEQMTKYYLLQQGRLKTYLAQMNKTSKKIHMKNSAFANPHGLSNPDNFSCAEDLGKLCTYTMRNQMFRTVVCTQYYTAHYKTPLYNGDEGAQNFQNEWGTVKWQNTNKMLKQGWSGIKTGITPNAGPCLAASIKKYLNGRDLQFLVILINSKSMEARWEEVKEIVDWVISQEIYF